MEEDIQFLWRLFMWSVLICAAWKILEVLFYHEVEARIVDDIMYVTWILTLFRAYCIGKKSSKDT